MDKNSLIKLTTNLYRLTLLFPKKEPLRYKVRELADEILENGVLIIGGNPHQPPHHSIGSGGQSEDLVLEIEKKLEILDSYFEVAKSQNWVSPFDVTELQKEYNKLKDEMVRVGALDSLKEKAEVLGDHKVVSLKRAISFDIRQREKGERGEKILEVLRERGRIQVGELQKVFPQISKRTLRRDFNFLMEQGLVERVGERNDTFYQLKDRTEVGQT